MGRPLVWFSYRYLAQGPRAPVIKSEHWETGSVIHYLWDVCVLSINAEEILEELLGWLCVYLCCAYF